MDLYLEFLIKDLITKLTVKIIINPHMKSIKNLDTIPRSV
mgnify:CR=1 FL=1